MIDATATATVPELEFRVELERRIEASIETVFESLVGQLGPYAEAHDGSPMPMKIETHPGGRWYRDLDGDDGHLWAHVQAIKRPTLLELTGPLFMSRPVSNNVQYRLEDAGSHTVLRLVHTAFGPLEDEWREGVSTGWAHQLDQIASRCS